MAFKVILLSLIHIYSFYEDKLTQSTKKPFRSVNFGVKIDKDGSSVYTYLNGMERKSVYYSRREDKAKGITCLLYTSRADVILYRRA